MSLLNPDTNLPWWHIFSAEANPVGPPIFTWDAYQDRTVDGAIYRWLIRGDAHYEVECMRAYGSVPVNERRGRYVYALQIGGQPYQLTWAANGSGILVREGQTAIFGASRFVVAMTYCEQLVGLTDEQIDQARTAAEHSVDLKA